MNKQLITKVQNDINRAEIALRENKGFADLVNELYGSYSNVSSNFPKIDMNPLFLMNHPETYKGYLMSIKGFLESYQLNNCEDYRFDDTNKFGINVITNVSNTNTLTVEDFEKAKSEIEKLSSLEDGEIDELITKIDDLKVILDSNDRPAKKWANAREIIKYALDKGIDVFKTIMPIISKILFDI